MNPPERQLRAANSEDRDEGIYEFWVLRGSGPDKDIAFCLISAIVRDNLSYLYEN